MEIDLLPLINKTIDVINLDESIEVPESLYKNTDIRRLTGVKLVGYIDDIGDNIFNIKVNVSGTMILPCALSLEDVVYPFSININQNVGKSDDFEEIYKIITNSLDILPILWENIVLEIPNKVIKENAKIKTEGDGWSLTEPKELKNNQLSELKELLEMEGKE